MEKLSIRHLKVLTSNQLVNIRNFTDHVTLCGMQRRHPALHSILSHSMCKLSQWNLPVNSGFSATVKNKNVYIIQCQTIKR